MPDHWENDAVQFPRLLAEISAIGLSGEQVLCLCDSMDLEPTQIKELLTRADEAFDDIKSNIKTPSPPAEELLYEIGAHEGWNEDTFLRLCLEYIDNQLRNCVFLDFLDSKRSEGEVSAEESDV